VHECTSEKVRGVGNRAVTQSTTDRLGIAEHATNQPAADVEPSARPISTTPTAPATPP
jgi:hypothetical protein